VRKIAVVPAVCAFEFSRVTLLKLRRENSKFYAGSLHRPRFVRQKLLMKKQIYEYTRIGELPFFFSKKCYNAVLIYRTTYDPSNSSRPTVSDDRLFPRIEKKYRITEVSEQVPLINKQWNNLRSTATSD